MPIRLGRNFSWITTSRGVKKGRMSSATTRWMYCHSFCRQKVNPAYAVWEHFTATKARVLRVAVHTATFSSIHPSFNSVTLHNFLLVMCELYKIITIQAKIFCENILLSANISGVIAAFFLECLREKFSGHSAQIFTADSTCLCPRQCSPGS